MIDDIEKTLTDRLGSSIFIALFLGFLFTVLFQSYVSRYLFAFFGFISASILVGLGLFATLRLKIALENEEKK